MATHSACVPALPPLDHARHEQLARHGQLACFAKALGHPARIQIIETLMARKTCIGCDIVEEIGLAASTISEHLRILKDAGLIMGEIVRPRVCYSLSPAAMAPLRVFLTVLEAAHLAKTE
jgi:ArsR family transcriptional regulator, arsenate/arsenite/antimonite-responsive transcriptional repressor